MKTIILTFIILITFSLSHAQSLPDSNRVKLKDKNKVQVKEQVQGDTTFQNGEKVQQRLMEQNRTGNKFGKPFGKFKKGKDVFIDKDGDGICDQRVNGMGFDKHRKRFKGQQGGKGHGGNGSGNGSGGN